MAAAVSRGPATRFGAFDALLLDPLPGLEDFFSDMPIDGYDGDPASSYENHLMEVELEYFHLDSAEESLSLPPQSASLTGGAVAASDSMPSYVGSAVASHQSNNQSTARPTVDSLSGGSSRSPATTSQILTPASTNPEYNASLSDSNLLDDEDTDENLSPTSDRSYVYVSHPHSYPSGNLPGPQMSHMSNHRQQPSSSQGSGASDVQQLSRASSVAPSTASFGAQWGNFPAPGAPFMDNQHPQHRARDNSGYYAPGNYPPGANAFTSSGQTYGDVVITDLTSPDIFNASMPFRPAYDQQQMFAQNIYGASSNIAPGYHQTYLRPFSQANPSATQHAQHDQLIGQQHGAHHGSSAYPTQLTIPSTASLLVQAQDNPLTAPPKMEQMQTSPSPMQHAPQFVRRPTVPSHRTSPYPQPTPRPGAQNTATSQSGMQYPATGAIRQPAPSVSAANRPLQAARARSTLPSNAPRASATEHGRKGGRQKGVHLAVHAKEKSSKMRKVVACWRCALQRDPVCCTIYLFLERRRLLTMCDSATLACHATDVRCELKKAKHTTSIVIGPSYRTLYTTSYLVSIFTFYMTVD